MKILLDVPYRSQQGNRQRKDCGAAVIACLARVEVDDVLSAIHQPEDAALGFQDIYRGLRYYGLPYLFRGDLDFDSIREAVAERYPVMLLANYGMLPKADKVDQLFKGAHWYLVVGADLAGVYVHDVNRPRGNKSGQFLYIEAGLLMRMMAKPGGDDPKWYAKPNQGLIIRRTFPIIPQKPASDSTVATMDDVIKELIYHKNRVAQLQKEVTMQENIIREQARQVQELKEKLSLAMEGTDDLE